MLAVVGTKEADFDLVLRPNQELTRNYSIESIPFAKGYIAQVRRVTLKSSGVTYAAKYSPRFKCGQETFIGLDEMRVLHSIDCRNVIRFVHGFVTEFYYVAITELALGGDLQSLIDVDIVLLEVDVRIIVEQILGALMYIHNKSVVHLDIKPQNILLMNPFPSHHVKLCDFEISKKLQPGVEIREIVGTPDYIAPEVLELEPITYSPDIWSLGVTTYVLLTGFSPFGGDTDSETFSNILDTNPVEFPSELFDDVSDLAVEFVACCVDKTKTKRKNRPTSQALLSHPWIVNKHENVAKELLLKTSAGLKRLSKSTLDLPGDLTHKSRDKLYEKLRSSSQLGDKLKMSKSREQLWRSKVNLRESMEELSTNGRSKWVSMDNIHNNRNNKNSPTNGAAHSSRSSECDESTESCVSVQQLIQNWNSNTSMDVILEENSTEFDVCTGVVAKFRKIFEK